MLYGGPASSVEDVDRLRRLGFDFAEIAVPNPTARRIWWESGIKSSQADHFFLVAHGPLEDTSQGDSRYLWDHYLPTLVATVDTVSRMAINLLTIHMTVDRRLVSELHLTEKIRALKHLVEYGRRNDAQIALENVTEDVFDLEQVLKAVPGLCLTLDVGHAQLGSPSNKSLGIIERCGPAIRHVHLHDNKGGLGQKADLHLSIGQGMVDFPCILAALVGKGYRETMTLEMKPEGLLQSKVRIEAVLEDISRRDSIKSPGGEDGCLSCPQ